MEFVGSGEGQVWGPEGAAYIGGRKGCSEGCHGMEEGLAQAGRVPLGIDRSVGD